MVTLSHPGRGECECEEISVRQVTDLDILVTSYGELWCNVCQANQAMGLCMASAGESPCVMANTSIRRAVKLCGIILLTIRYLAAAVLLL